MTKVLVLYYSSYGHIEKMAGAGLDLYLESKEARDYFTAFDQRSSRSSSRTIIWPALTRSPTPTGVSITEPDVCGVTSDDSSATNVPAPAPGSSRPHAR